jgi:hypothetical protein
MKKKMERSVNKLYRNRAEVRDYDVQAAIQKNEKFVIKHNGDIMTLSPSDLQNKLVSRSTNIFKSKMGGKDYRLCAYDWNPDVMDY